MAIRKSISFIEEWFGLLCRSFDNGKITRRVTLFWMLWLTTEIFRWSMAFAEKGTSTLETAAIIGAILTPLAGLHAAIFSFYRSAHAPPVVHPPPTVTDKPDAQKPK